MGKQNVESGIGLTQELPTEEFLGKYGCYIYKDLTLSQFYSILLNPVLMTRFVFITDKIEQRLRKHKKNPKLGNREVDINLLEVSGDTKYGEGNIDGTMTYQQVLEYHKVKALSDISQLNGPISHPVLVSAKPILLHQVTSQFIDKNRVDVFRIIGFGYQSYTDQGLVFIDDSLIKTNPSTAAGVIREIRLRIGLSESLDREQS